jgi:hypothetical protein
LDYDSLQRRDTQPSRNVEGTLVDASMGDARFFARVGPHALADIAAAAKGTAPAIEKAFTGIAPLQSARLAL